MADPLSGAASAIAVIQISTKTLELCWKYISEVKDAKEDIERLRDELEALQNVIQKLQDLIERSTATQLPTVGSLQNPLESCLSQLRILNKKLQPRAGQKTMRRLGLRTLKWPLMKKDVDKTIAVLQNHKATFNTALSLDQM
jgi:chromosome segregation ATPase